MYQSTSNKQGESSSSSSQPPQQQQNANEQDQEQHGDTCSIPPAQSGNADSRSRGTGNNNTSAVQQRGGEVNLTLGGIDLNNSGSVVVKADKKLLTVLFPDGRDGRAFTLKADTMEDLQEWKTALENALTQAPSASHVMGQNGIFRNDNAPDAPPVDVDEPKDETPTNLTVFGRPVLLALEEVDGSPSFLEKALRFVEDHGTRAKTEGILRQAADVDDVNHRIREYEQGAKTEGILRQAADVDDVNHRIREYEQGRNEFTATEDAHVIGDCLKTVLREMPSSPVPASCCNALLEACRDRGHRVNAMREAISESFPEPNRRLLQRILMMMLVVASNKNVNRMNTNAVAACMAPLLLRPLLHGDCEIENDFDVGGDGSVQLLQAAAAANHAQAIVITLLEEYDSIFGEGSLSAGLYSDSEESGSGSEEGTDDEEYGDDDGTQGSGDYTDEEEDLEDESEGSYSESEASVDHHGDDIDDDHKARSHTKINDTLSSESKSPKGSMKPQVTKKLLSGSNRSSLPRHDDARKDDNILAKGSDHTDVKAGEVSKTEDRNSSMKEPSTLSSASGESKRHWGRAHGKRNLSMESIDFSAEVDEADADVERLETTKSELQNKITEEVKNNAVLHSSLERRKKALYERREALEKDVERLQEQLQQERDKKAALESGLNMSKGNKPIPETTDVKLKKDLQDVAQAEDDITNLEHKVDDLENRLGQQDVKASGASKESRRSPEHNAKMKEKQKDTEAAASQATLKGDARGNEIEKQQDSRGKSSQKAAGTSKRSGSKGEGNTTTSALSKLTMRLNFLKERRSQIANELSNMDKGKSSSGQPSPSSGQKKSPQESERGTGSNQNQDSDSSKLTSPHVLDRGRSDNGGDRSRGSGGGNHPSTTPRTFSR
ncbi:hypothetical protein DY000_02054245 [Brassica cretica]|uniref:Rho-GAP domain-containing protein n=1 Tax=Brassica cretica TaxID=69181 RepID=A0ABQ7ALB8_BRACR|nr:hypothetical protein DY000_02054245 [Brassica cretica]